MGLRRTMSTFKIKKPGCVRAFLVKCVRNASRDILRSRRQDAKHAAYYRHQAKDCAQALTPLEKMVTEEEHQALVECMKELPPKHRLVIVLRFVGLLSLEDLEKCLPGLEKLGWDMLHLKDAYVRGPHKIEEIAKHTAKHGVSTVGGVGNILKVAKRRLKECFDKKAGTGSR